MDQLSCSKFSDGSIGSRPILLRNWYNDTLKPSNNFLTNTENVLISRRFSTQTQTMGKQIMVFTNCLFTNSNGTLDLNNNLILGNYSGASLINMNSINLDIAGVVFQGFQQISDGSGLPGNSIMIQSQQSNKGSTAFNNVTFREIQLITNSTTSSSYLLDYFNQNSPGINNFNNLQIQNVVIGSSSNNSKQFLLSFQVQESIATSILFGVTNFVASNLTLYNTNKNETGYETNDYSILYITGFDSCAISGLTMRNIQSPQKNLKLMRFDQSNNILSMRRLNFQNITVKQGWLLPPDQVKLYDIQNTSRQTIKTATLLKISANQAINMRIVNFHNITILGHPIKVFDSNNQNNFQQIVVYNSSLIDFSLSDNTKIMNQQRIITTEKFVFNDITFNQTAFTTQSVFNEGFFFLIKTGTPESPQQLISNATLFSDQTQITSLNISGVTGLVNKSRDFQQNNQGHVIRVDGPTNLSIQNSSLELTAISFVDVVKGIRPPQYQAGVNLTFAFINIDFNKYRNYERQRSSISQTLYILNIESRVLTLAFQYLQIIDLQKCLIDSPNLNVSLFNIDTSLVQSMQFLNVTLSQTNHLLNNLQNFPSQASNMLVSNIDKSILTKNFITIFNISGQSNLVPVDPTNYLIDGISIIGMNFSQVQSNISVINLSNTISLTLSLSNLNVQQIDAGISSLSLVNLNGNISDLSMQVNRLTVKQTIQGSFKNALINILPFSILQNMSITFDGVWPNQIDISNNIGKVLQINLPPTVSQQIQNQIIFKSSQIRQNQAMNNLIQISLNKQSSLVSFLNVEISNNQIFGNQSSVIKTIGLANSSDYNNGDSLIMKDMRFVDNLAQGIGSTNGISISQDPQTLQAGGYMSIQVQNTIFRSQLLLDQNKKLQNGSYIQIIPQKNSVINLNIDSSSFLLGSAYAGGAIYYGPNQINTSLKNATSLISTNDAYAGQWGFYLTITNSQFIQNQVYTSGAAIFLDFLNTYFLKFDQLDFQQNLGQVYGDNIYLRQVQQLTGVSQNNYNYLRSLQTSNLLDRKVSILSVNHYTPNTQNQVYLESIEDVTILNNTFQPAITTNSQEGGSIYALNSIRLKVQDSNFLSQIATIRGGAIYQRTDQALKPIPNQMTLITNSLFTKCKAQQGGCLYFNNSNVVISQKTKITNSTVVLLDLSTQSFNQFIQDPLLQKSYTIADSQQKLGKGPAIYFECSTSQNCECDISSDSLFGNNQIYDFSNQQFISGKDNDIFYPEIPALQETPDMANFKQPSVTNSTNIVIIMAKPSPTALFTYINRIVLTGKQANKEDVFTIKNSIPFTDFPGQNNINNSIGNLFGLSSFQIGSSQNSSYLFGDSFILPVVDFFQNIQALDNQSSIQIDCTQPKSSLTGIIINIACILDSGEQFEKKIFFAVNGFIKIPAIRILAPPNSLVQIKLNFKMISTRLGRTTQFIRTFQIQMSSCLPNEIVNLKGLCQYCPGPDYYNINTKDLLSLQNNSNYILQQCIKCPKDYITCYGGSNTSTNKGVRILNNSKALFTPEYINCSKLGAVQPCLANNQCMKGYQGILCSQCTDGYYKSGVSKGGQCLQCNSSSIFTGTYEKFNEAQSQRLNDTLLLVELIVIWSVPFFGIVYLVILARRAQNIQENPQNNEIIITQRPSTTSVNEQLLRSLINYIGLIALTFLIYADYWWIDEISQFDDDLQISQLRRYTHQFLNSLIYLWGLPLNRSSEIIQCTSFLKYGQDGDSGLLTQELVNYVIGCFLIGISIIFILINCGVNTCNCRKSEQIPKNDNPELFQEIQPGLNASKTLQYGDTISVGSYILPNLQNISQTNVQYYQPKDQQEFSDLKNISSIEMTRFDRAINSFQEQNLRNNNLQQNFQNGPYLKQNQTGFTLQKSSITIREDDDSQIQIASQSQQNLMRNNIYLQNSPDQVFQDQQMDKNNISPFDVYKKFERNQQNKYFLEGGTKENLIKIQQNEIQKSSETRKKSKTKRDASKTKEKKAKSTEVTKKNNEQQVEEKQKNQKFNITNVKASEQDSKSQQSKTPAKSSSKSPSKSRILKLQIQDLFENQKAKKSDSQPPAISNNEKKKKKKKKNSGNKSDLKVEIIQENIVPIPEVNEEKEVDTYRQHYDVQQFHDEVQYQEYDDIERSIKDHTSYQNIPIIHHQPISWNVYQFNITTLIVAFAAFIITPQFLASQFMLYSCFTVQPVQPLIDSQLETLASFNIVQPNTSFVSLIDSSFTCPTRRINAKTLDFSGYFQPILFGIYGVFLIILSSLFILRRSENQQYLNILRDSFSNLIIKGGLGAMVAFKSIVNSPTAEVIIAWTGFILFLSIHIYVSTKNNSTVLNKLNQDKFEISESEIANVKRIIRINSFLCFALFCTNLSGMIQWIDHIYGSYTYTQYVTQNNIQDSNTDIAAYIILMVGQFLFLFYWLAEFIWNLKNYIFSFMKKPEQKPEEKKHEVGQDLVLNNYQQDLNISQNSKSSKFAKKDRFIKHLVNQKDNFSQEDGKPSISNTQKIEQSVYNIRNGKRFIDPSFVGKQINLQQEITFTEISENFTDNGLNKQKNSFNTTQKLFQRNASQPNYKQIDDQSSFQGLSQLPQEDEFQLGQKYYQFNKFRNESLTPLTHNQLAASQQVISNHNASIENLSIYHGSQKTSQRGLLDQSNFNDRFLIQKSEERTINQFEQFKNNKRTETKLLYDKKLLKLNENSSLELDLVDQDIGIDNEQEIKMIDPVDLQKINIQINDSQNNNKDPLEFTLKSVLTIVDENISKSAADHNKLSSRRESQNVQRDFMQNGLNMSYDIISPKLENLIDDENQKLKNFQSNLLQPQQSINSFDISVQVFDREGTGEIMPLDNTIQSNLTIKPENQITFGLQTQYIAQIQSIDIKKKKSLNVRNQQVPIKSTQRNLKNNIKKSKASKKNTSPNKNKLNIKNENNQQLSNDFVPIKFTQRILKDNNDIKMPEASEDNTSLIYNQQISQNIEKKVITPNNSIPEPSVISLKQSGQSEKIQNQLANDNSLTQNQGDFISMSPICINLSQPSSLKANEEDHNQLEVTQQSEILNTEQQLEEEAELARKREELQKKVEMIKRLKEMKNQYKETSNK